jgi:hypothetical protein
MKRLVILTMLLAASSTYAIGKVTNIGFIKNPPKELTDRFPMCDAFLKVQWLNKKEKIGYSHYQIYNGKTIKQMWALVYLTKQHPHYNLDLYQQKIHNKLTEVFEMVKHGKNISKNPQQWLIMSYKGKTETFWPRGGEYNPSLSNHTQTVCLAYPGYKKVWIVDGKSVANSYSKKEIAKFQKQFLDEYTQSLRESHNIILDRKGKNNFLKWFKTNWVLDVNFDGVNDFISGYSVNYLYKRKAYSNKKVIHSYESFEFFYPPTKKSCTIPQNDDFSLTTDGKSYYISNCNITDLIPKNR